MTFSDIFKFSFLENVTSVSVLDMVLALGLTVAFLYRKKGWRPLLTANFSLCYNGRTKTKEDAP